MNRLIHAFFSGWLILFLCAQVSAQPNVPAAPAAVLPSMPLAVTLHKTTHLVFPYAIRSVDRGSPSILVQQAEPLENILRVKAGVRDFPETSLTVITADGSLFSFTVSYDEHPAALNLQLAGTAREEPAPVAQLAGGEGSPAALEQQALRVAATQGKVPAQKTHRGGMQLRLDGVYIQGDVLYCRLRVRNRSHIGYDAEALRFHVRERKAGRRTASQEVEVAPLHVHGAWETVRGQAEQVLVVALPKMTLPRQQYLAVELVERRGGRHLQLKVPGRRLLRAAPLLPGKPGAENHGITH